MCNMKFSGSFEIEDFTLNAKQFILRDDEISFEFVGDDEYGKFKIEGIASKTKDKIFMAPKLNVEYPSYNHDDIASIKIEPVTLTEDKSKCMVNGLWIQDGESWGFSGLLELSVVT